jgi:probable addiction module antidote protein
VGGVSQIDKFWREFQTHTKLITFEGKAMTEKLTTYDPAVALVDDTEIAFFMAEALETGDGSYIAKCVGVVARAKGMAGVAEETGLSREQLYRSFSEDGNPTLKSTLAVMKALGIELTAKVPDGA